ncbi:MAG TPA: PHP domain-containing protein [Candidatus Binatus sp.]|nr:PHP domain-containing protein [Candidatus Binatus sp.]
MPATYAELHCHTNFSFLDGASPAEDLVERAVELQMPSLAVTDHQGLYGVVRFALAAEAAGIHPVLGVEVELADAAVADPAGVVIPARRPGRAESRAATAGRAVHDRPPVVDGLPSRPRPARARLPGHRRVVKEDLRRIGERQRGPHLVLLARDGTGYRSLCRLLSRANLDGTKRVARLHQALLAEHAEGLVALSGCRDGEIARRQPGELLARLQVGVPVRAPQVGQGVERPAVEDRGQDVAELSILGPGVVDVVRDDRGQAQLVGERGGLGDEPVIVRPQVV